MKLSNTQIILGAAAAAAVFAFMGNEAAKAALNEVNPTNPDNIFYDGVNAIGDILNDGEQDQDFNLGAWLFDVFN